MGTGAGDSTIFSQGSFDFLAEMRFDSLILNSFDLDSSERTDKRNSFAAVAPVSEKIAIGCEDKRIPFHLGHADQAGICKRHGHILVALHVVENFLRMIAIRKVRIDADKLVPKQSSKRAGPAANGSEKKKRFGDNGFAGD